MLTAVPAAEVDIVAAQAGDFAAEVPVSATADGQVDVAPAMLLATNRHSATSSTTSVRQKIDHGLADAEAGRTLSEEEFDRPKSPLPFGGGSALQGPPGPERSGALCGLTTGCPARDHLGPGVLPGGLYVIAGRPGMGKTSLALDLTRHVAVELKRPVGVFSLEMRSDEIGLKLGSAEADIGSRQLRNGHLSTRQWQDLFAATRRMLPAPEA